MPGSRYSYCTLLLLVLTLLTSCSAYLRLADSGQLNHQVVTADYQEGRRFSWMINWLNERGPVGQVFANLVIALFVLPPLGPIVCIVLENCDTARSSARNLMYQIAGSDYSSGRSLSEGGLSDHYLIDMLRTLDMAYDDSS